VTDGVRPGSALDASRIERELDRLGVAVGRPLSVAASTRSTNDDARRAAAAGAPHGAAFLADEQTAGRGRGEHVWHSPPGENLYLSLVLRPDVPAARIAPLALVAGVAVARAVGPLLAVVAREPRIKWPNDVLVDDRKLAGVLVEAQLRGAAVASVVVGVGLNVRTARFPPELEARATSLAALGVVEPDRSLLAARLIAELGRAAAWFGEHGFGSFVEELAARDALRGRPVEAGGVRGVAEGIDAEGHLLLRAVDGGRHAIVAGAVHFAPLDASR
jgi:BirA family biotin operon repressor/biotin-[acetyl-CoA-carboxylase] ligase